VINGWNGIHAVVLAAVVTVAVAGSLTAFNRRDLAV
jgi:hypothetical protein